MITLLGLPAFAGPLYLVLPTVTPLQVLHMGPAAIEVPKNIPVNLWPRGTEIPMADLPGTPGPAGTVDIFVTTHPPFRALLPAMASLPRQSPDRPETQVWTVVLDPLFRRVNARVAVRATRGLPIIIQISLFRCILPNAYTPPPALGAVILFLLTVVVILPLLAPVLLVICPIA